MHTGDSYYDSKEFRELLTQYEDAVNTGQPVFMDADELCDIADFYQLTNQFEQARAAINLASSLSPGAVGPLSFRIREALYNGDTEQAWQLLEQIIEKDDPDYVYDRGEILIAEGRVDDADIYFREEFRKVPAEEYQDFLIDVANIYSDYGLSEKAMEWISRARNDDSPEFKEIMARTLFGLGKYKDSERLFDELIDTDPYQKRYWNALASAQFMNEDYTHSVQSSEYAIAIDPDDPEGIIAKANGLYRLYNFEKAAEYYRRYREHEPDDEFAILHEGTCLLNIGQVDEAIELLKYGEKVSREHEAEGVGDIHQYLPDIYQELAFAYSEKGDPDTAIEYLEKTDDLECDHIQIQVIKGHVMLTAGNVEKAERYFRSAIQHSDDSMQTLLRVIVSLYDNKYLESAYKMLQKYFMLVDDDNTEGYAYMALFCHDLKYYDEYLRYLKMACKINPKECATVLSHLFPEGLAPEKYYEYLQNKMKK